MKKLYIFALLASAAVATESVTEDVKDIGGQFAEVVTIPAGAIKDAAISTKNKLVDATKKGYEVAKTQAKEIANSDAAQDIADVAGQLFVDMPCQVGADIKDGAQKVAQVTKDTAQKVADSKFAQGARDVAQQAFVDFPKEVASNVKDASVKVAAAIKTGAVKVKDATVTATDKVVDATKKSAEYIKEKATAVANSEAGQDISEVGGQFASAPREAWEEITNLARSIKSAIID